MTDHPAADSAKPAVFSCIDMARHIAETRGHCDRTTVWRAVQRLGLRPVETNHRGFKFYTAAQLELVKTALRNANRATA